MSTLKFKTTIKCGGCIAKVTPALNETVGEGNWLVDLATPDKMLTVETDSTTPADIQKALENVGYKAESI
jgi:copper chaperone CopZ